MTLEYVVLGILLIVMGAIQAWLHHGPGAKALEALDKDGPGGLVEKVLAAELAGQRLARDSSRGSRLWRGWTSIMGGVGIVLGIVLVFLGVLGR